MMFGSVCSGIEAASCAWKPLGWRAAFVSEVEPFPCAVLAHHFPDVPNLGDMTKFEDWPDATIDLLVGGTPCQSFSVAGLRKGLDDPRGNLMLTFGAIARRYRPRWLVWENVPGVLSSNGGRDFGTFLGMLGELGYGFAYRVLDAQYFGVAQRRRRVFVVGCLGDWRAAAAVLFEHHSLSGNPAPRRETRKVVAEIASNGTRAICGAGNQANAGRLISYSTKLHHTASNGARKFYTEYTAGLDARSPPPAIAVSLRGRAGGGTAELGDEVQNCLRASTGGGDKPHILSAMQVRRLTPRECERLQGFEDDWTLIPWTYYQRVQKLASKHGVSFEEELRKRGKILSGPELHDCPDGPRYKAIGNSMPVPVMYWIGERIQEVDQICKEGHDPMQIAN